MLEICDKGTEAYHDQLKPLTWSLTWIKKGSKSPKFQQISRFRIKIGLFNRTKFVCWTRNENESDVRIERILEFNVGLTSFYFILWFLLIRKISIWHYIRHFWLQTFLYLESNKISYRFYFAQDISLHQYRYSK